MFAKISRYRKLPNLVAIDADGRQLESKEIRLLPAVEGTFLHTIEELDRLDHLAYKYYKQPRKWWLICDANPEFMSPVALLGKEPVITVHLQLTFNDTDAQPPWSNLLKKLSEHVGVENIKITDDVQIVTEEQRIADQQQTIHTEQPERAVEITYNEMNVSAEELATVIASTGFAVGEPKRVGRIGKSIIIPQNIIG